MNNILKKIKHVYNVTHSTIREKIKSRSRSSQWDNVREEFLKSSPFCLACGSSTRLQVHHVKPFHIYPELELDQMNLVALCMSEHDCHLYIGHGGNFKCWNPNVVENALTVKCDPTQRQLIEKNIKENRKK